jgi:hypothetical protein
MAYYCLKYATKSQKEVEDVLNWYLHKFQKACDYYPQNEGNDNFIVAKRRILSITYAMTSKQEVAEPLACLYIIRQSPFYFSHDFININVAAVINQIYSQTTRISMELHSEDMFVYVNQLTEYLQRSKHFADTCWYDFVATTTKKVETI